MPGRRYEPSFLLNCVVFLFVIGASFGAFGLARWVGSGLPLLIALGTGATLFLLSDLGPLGHRRDAMPKSSPWRKAVELTLVCES